MLGKKYGLWKDNKKFYITMKKVGHLHWRRMVERNKNLKINMLSKNKKTEYRLSQLLFIVT